MHFSLRRAFWRNVPLVVAIRSPRLSGLRFSSRWPRILLFFLPLAFRRTDLTLPSSQLQPFLTVFADSRIFFPFVFSPPST